MDDLITYNYFGHLEYLTFCFACRLFTKTLSLHPFFNLKAAQKSSKLQKRRKQKPRKGICPEVKSIKLQDEKWHWSAFFDFANPKGNSSSKLLRIEDRAARRTFRGPPSQFRENKFFFCKTIAKGKVQAKYLKHLNYSIILIIFFFFENFDFNVAILETPGPIGCDKMTEMSLLIYLHEWIKQSLNKCKILSSQAVTWFSWNLIRFQRWIVPRLLAWHFLCQSA